MSGPFGLSMGMRVEDFDPPLQELSPYRFLVPNVPKPHSAFDKYAVRIMPRAGLSFIKAVGKTIETSSYGYELMAAFGAMEAKLSSSYGQCERQNYLLDGSVFNEPRDWMHAKLSKERVIVSEWSTKTGASMRDSIASIYLLIGAYDVSSGCVAVEYYFTNDVDADAEIASLEDSAL